MSIAVGAKVESAANGASKKTKRKGVVLAGERMLVVKLVRPVATTVMGPRTRLSLAGE